MRESLDILFAFSGQVAHLLFVWSWQAALLAVCIRLVLKFYRSQSARLRYQIWLIGLIAIAVLPLWTRINMWLPLPQAPQIVLADYVGMQKIVAPFMLESLSPRADVVAPVVTFTHAFLSGIWAALFAVWLIGFFIAFRQLCRSYLKLRRVRRRARATSIEALECCTFEYHAPLISQARICLSTEVQSPSFAGLLHPVILLPADILNWTTAKERTAILQHELAHLARRDHYANFFQALLGSIFFFHPLVRYALNQLNIEREMSCDEAVLGFGANANLYVESLLKVAAQTLAPDAFHQPAYFASKKTLQRRIEMILKQDGTRRSSRYWPLLVMPAAFLLGFTMWLLVPAQVAQISEDETAIRTLLREAAENEMTRDDAVFDRIAADEFVRIGANGEVWDKARTREFAKESSNWTISSIETRDLKIRLYGEAAAVTALGIAKGQDSSGRNIIVRNRCSFMLVKRAGRWQCVSVQQTRIA